MKKLLLFIFIVATLPVFSQNDLLRGKIQKIVQDKDANVGVALIVDGKDTLIKNNTIIVYIRSYCSETIYL